MKVEVKRFRERRGRMRGDRWLAMWLLIGALFWGAMWVALR